AKITSKAPVRRWIDSRVVMAWRLSGTMWGVPIFEPRRECLTPSIGSRSPGMTHMERLKSISSQRAKRNSLDRIKTNRESATARRVRSEEHTSELQSREKLVCRLLLEKKKPR